MVRRRKIPTPEPRQWARDTFLELALSVPSPALWYKNHGEDRTMLEATPPEQRMLPREKKYISDDVQQEEDDPLVIAIGKENAALMTAINGVKASTLPDQFTIAEWMQAQKDDVKSKYQQAGIPDAENVAALFIEKAQEILAEALKGERVSAKARPIKRPQNQRREFP